MGNTLLAVALLSGVGQGPYVEGEVYDVGGMGGYPTVVNGAYGEPMYPYDVQDPWMHGYFQRMPAYRGYAAFRPYNYKHVLSQTQTAAGWGMDPTMAYSQQFWHRYQGSASLNTTGVGTPSQVPMAAQPNYSPYHNAGFGRRP